MTVDPYLTRIANQLADIAGEIANRYFRKNLPTSLKTEKSPVTKADLFIEKALRKHLNQHLPTHGILGEEYGLIPSQCDYVWVLDPIDGTASFACGKTTFCTLIALVKNATPILGIVDQPITRERWIGVLGKQSTYNGDACFSNQLNSKNSLKLSCTTPTMFDSDEKNKRFSAIHRLASVISYGGDAYAYGLLASGHIDMIFESDLKFYDVAALIPIIAGSGGSISDWQGNAIDMNHFNGDVLAVSNQRLQKKILASIKNV